MSTALFPGSFDPFTVGHKNIVQRALRLFDKVVVAVGVNSDKSYMFPLEQRLKLIRDSFPQEGRVEVLSYSGMTVDFCRKTGAHCILRGVRNSQDMVYEQTVAAVNRTLAPEIDTLILFADAEFVDVSSTLEREKLLHP